MDDTIIDQSTFVVENAVAMLWQRSTTQLGCVRTSISILDQQDICLSTTLQAIQNRLHRRIATLRHKRNQLLAISSLPADVMACIFDASLSYGSERVSGERLSNLYKLSRVCRSWYMIAEGTPQLHATFTLADPLPAIRSALLKSKESPLMIFHPTTGDEDASAWLSCQARAEAITTILQHFHRCSYVDLVIPPSYPRDALDSVLSRPAASLESLSLAVLNHNGCLDHLFGGQANKLRHLALRFLFIPPNSPLIFGLQSLKIEEPTPTPSLSDWVTLLQNATGLESLVLTNIGSQPQVFSDGPFISLPFVKTFKLRTESPGTAANMLSALMLPNCHQVSIECPAPEFGESSLWDFLDRTPLLHRCQRYSVECDELTAQLSFVGWIGSTPSTPDLRITLQRAAFSKLMNDLGSISGFEGKLGSLSMKGFYNVDSSMTMDHLRKFSSIRSLSLFHCGDITAFLHFLHSKDHNNLYLLPCLARLSITYCRFDHFMFLTSLTHRYHLSRIGSRAPTAFELVQVKGMDMSTEMITAYQNLLGPGRFNLCL